MSISGQMTGAGQGSVVWVIPGHNAGGDYLYTTRTYKDTDQTTTSTTSGVAVTDLNLPCKANSVYGFSYDLMWSNTGLLCGGQFAIDFIGGAGTSLTSLSYGLSLVTIGNGVIGDAATSANTWLGQSASIAGGGPKTARIFGCVRCAGTLGGDIVLKMRAVGVTASVTVLANSTGKCEEM